MFFDDRLATVLRQKAQSDISRRTQFRQLLDILGSERTLKPDAARDDSLIAAAWLRMDALAEAIPANARAQMIREPGWRFRNPALAAHLADFEPDVASAALNRAQLTAQDWTALIPRLPVRARGFLRLRRDLPVDADQLLDRLGVHDRGLPSPLLGQPPSGQESSEPAPLAHPSPEPEPEPETETEPEPTGADAQIAPTPVQEGRSEISAIVERIAQFKRDRDLPESAGPSDSSQGGDNDNPLMPRLPLGEGPLPLARQVHAFGFVADTAGRIEWADGDVARMVMGKRLFPSRRLGEQSDQGPLLRAFARRQPIIAASVMLDGAEAITGEWIVDGQPRFTEAGHFSGYVGRFRRLRDAGSSGPTEAESEADRIRQLLHELRTPVTAIQGYAEIIQQQLFGTAPHEYRGLAAAIAADSARILAGFEELDRLARLDAGALELEPGSADLARMVHATCSQLAQVLAARLAGIEVEDTGEQSIVVALETDYLEALLWRLLATLGGACGAGEMLSATIEMVGPSARLTCEIPAQLLTEEDIFAAEARPVGSAINAGFFGAGFAMRLARAEAHAAGGALVREDEVLVLTLPLITTLDLSTDAPLESEVDA